MSVRRLLLWLCLIIVLSTLALAWLTYYLILDEKPMVLPSPTLDGAAIIGLQQQLSRQRAQETPDASITVSLAQSDIDTAINYALQTSAPDQLEGLIVTLQQDHATLAGCVILPTTLNRRYLNVRAVLAPHDLKLGIQQLQLGLVTLPTLIVNRLERAVLQAVNSNDQVPGLQAALASLDSISIDDARLAITYHDRAEASAANGAAPPALADLQPEQVNAYLATLRSLTANISSRRYPVTGLLTPLFAVAAQKSSAGADGATENAAAIAAIALYAGEPKLLSIAGLNGRFDTPSDTLSLTIHQRTDLAKHFINSALLYLLAGNEMAAFIGLQKELDDDHHGSGFSLADLVADQAGIRFAELATTSSSSALRLQNDVAALLYDDQLMPHPSTLPTLRSNSQRQQMSTQDSERYLDSVKRQVKPLLAPITLYHY